MSKKSSRTVKLPPPQATPRALPDIENEYRQTALQAGVVQYQLSVYTKELAQLNTHLEKLNYEGAARKELDAPVQPPVPTPNIQPTEEGTAANV